MQAKKIMLPFVFVCFFTLFYLAGSAQTQRVSGLISDSSGTGIPNVSVKVKGRTTGVVSTPSGNYSLSAENGDIIEFSSIGYLTVERTVSGPTLNVVLSSSVDLAEEEIVVVGYGTQKRSEVTTAISKVKAEDFNQGGARNPMDLIQGKVAGLNITRTQGNNPNSGVSIQLRGVTSLTGSNNPLIVIDGAPGANPNLKQNPGYK